MKTSEMLKDLATWCDEVIIRFNNTYKWTGLIILKDGFSANWQETNYEELVKRLWHMGKIRTMKITATQYGI